MAIFITTVKIFTGKQFTYAVEADRPEDAKLDLAEAIHADTRMPFGSFRVKEIRKSTRRTLVGMVPVKGCTSNGKQWAWVA
jgi:hypothetical protein